MLPPLFLLLEMVAILDRHGRETQTMGAIQVRMAIASAPAPRRILMMGSAIMVRSKEWFVSLGK
jgi:hypothetical protein